MKGEKKIFREGEMRGYLDMWDRKQMGNKGTARGEEPDRGASEGEE